MAQHPLAKYPPYARRIEEFQAGDRIVHFLDGRMGTISSFRNSRQGNITGVNVRWDGEIADHFYDPRTARRFPLVKEAE